MQDIYYGTCRFCGQMRAMDQCPENSSKEDLQEMATRLCDCSEAVHYRVVQSQIESAQGKVTELFTENAEFYGFQPLDDEHILELINQIIILVANGWIKSGQVQLLGRNKAKISMTNKGEIKVERMKSSSATL